MKISIIIPVYNVADYLRKCVESALNQQFDDYEVILVDDGSTDGLCPDLCDELQSANPDRIRVIHQENKGLGGARNTGIDASRGEYLLFVDSDDYISEKTLKNDTMQTSMILAFMSVRKGRNRLLRLITSRKTPFCGQRITPH